MKPNYRQTNSFLQAIDDDTSPASGENKETENQPESAALKWAKLQQQELGLEEDNVGNQSDRKKKYVIVGGGWGGWGAAKALCQSNVDCEVILIDALPDPTGVSTLMTCDK